MKTNGRRSWLLVSLVSMVFLTGCAAVHEVRAIFGPVDARRMLMKRVSKGWKQIKKGVKAGNTAGLDLVAHDLMLGAVQIPEAFRDKVITKKSRAKAAIWKQKDKFDGIARKLSKAVGKFENEAARRNLSKMKKAMKAIGKNCGACHKAFRKKKKKKR